MKAKFKRSASVAVNTGFQIAPMIDVVFVIMLFFMVMAGAVKRENALRMQLPGDGEGISMPDEIAIRVDDEGQVYFNDDPLDTPAGKALPELTGTLKEIKNISDAAQSELLVTIYADDLAKYDRVIDVLDSLRLANISGVSFQAGSPD